MGRLGDDRTGRNLHPATAPMTETAGTGFLCGRSNGLRVCPLVATVGGFRRFPKIMNRVLRGILEPDVAWEVIDFRDREFPLGFRHVRELLELDRFTHGDLDVLQHHFSNSFYG